MVTVKSMEFASLTLGVLGIVASLLVLGGPRPGPNVLPGIPSAQTCLQWLLIPAQEEDFPSNTIRFQWRLTPAQEEDFPSDMTCLQWLLSLDGGFSATVDEALGFPDMVHLTSVIHILANVVLLYGVFQSNSCFLVAFILYHILTTILGSIFTILASCNIIPYESLLVVLCLLPMESSVILLYGKSWFLPVFISVMKSVLIFCTVILLEEMDGIKKKAKPASENKMQIDLVFVVPV